MSCGHLFVISGASGVGKSSILKRVMAQMPDLQFFGSKNLRIAQFCFLQKTVVAISCFLYIPSTSRRTSCLCAF